MPAVSMAKNPDISPAEPTAVKETSMAEPIDQDQSSPLDKAGNDSHIGDISGPKDKRCLGVFETGQCGFKLLVRRQGSADQSGRPGSCPILLRCAHRCLDHIRMGSESEVIIGRQQNHSAPGYLHGRPRRRFKRDEMAGERLFGQLPQARLKDVSQGAPVTEW